MAYVIPKTYVTGEIVSAANLNENRDNVSDLHARTNALDAVVATAQTTTSTAFTDLTTSGPSVTVTTGTKALIGIYSRLETNTTNQAAVVGVAVSGATTRAASDALSLTFFSPAANIGFRGSAFLSMFDLTAGSNTFTLKYRVGGASTGTFSDRRIVVWPGGQLS